MIREQVYTLTETSNILGVNRATIRRWIKGGKLDAENIGGVVLLPRQQVDSILKQRGQAHIIIGMLTQRNVLVKGVNMQISDYFYTLGAAAKVLGITRISMWKWIQQGKIRGQKVGRETVFPKWEIELLAEARKSERNE
jgi:excisionase family DNA binding protein